MFRMIGRQRDIQPDGAEAREVQPNRTKMLQGKYFFPLIPHCKYQNFIHMDLALF